MKPKVSVILCTFERPRNLRMSLASLLGQQGVAGQMEVVIADDGSRDETPTIAEEFRQRADFPILFTTHPHTGFCLSQSRNEAVAASSGEHLVFLDGDCVVPPHHVALQLAHRRPDVVRIGDCIKMSEEVSAGVTEEMVRDGGYVKLVPAAARRKLYQQAWKDWYYNLIPTKSRPRLVGNNIALSRRDYDRVNGFDENFVGWGNEDDDFGRRLKRAGKSLCSILFWTSVFHLWHPLAASCPPTLEQGANIPYYRRGFHLVRCGNGLVKRTWRELTYDFRGNFTNELLTRVIPSAGSLPPPGIGRPAEVEVLFAPTSQRFTGKADCNVLVIANPAVATVPQLSQAHLVLCSVAQSVSLSSQLDASRIFGLDEFPPAMHYLLRHERVGASTARAA